MKSKNDSKGGFLNNSDSLKKDIIVNSSIFVTMKGLEVNDFCIPSLLEDELKFLEQDGLGFFDKKLLNKRRAKHSIGNHYLVAYKGNDDKKFLKKLKKFNFPQIFNIPLVSEYGENFSKFDSETIYLDSNSKNKFGENVVKYNISKKKNQVSITIPTQMNLVEGGTKTKICDPLILSVILPDKKLSKNLVSLLWEQDSKFQMKFIEDIISENKNYGFENICNFALPYMKDDHFEYTSFIQYNNQAEVIYMNSKKK